MDNPLGPGFEWRESLTVLNADVSIICACFLVDFTVFPSLATEIGVLQQTGVFSLVNLKGSRDFSSPALWALRSSGRGSGGQPPSGPPG